MYVHTAIHMDIPMDIHIFQPGAWRPRVEVAPCDARRLAARRSPRQEFAPELRRPGRVSFSAGKATLPGSGDRRAAMAVVWCVKTVCLSRLVGGGGFWNNPRCCPSPIEAMFPRVSGWAVKAAAAERSAPWAEP